MAEAFRIAILDYDSQGGVAERLGVLLSEAERADFPGFQVRHYTQTDPPSKWLEAADKELDLLVLVLGRLQITESEKVFESLRKNLRFAPVLAVASEAQPSDLMRLLKLGAADFVTLPVRDLDFLPRVQRLVERRRCSEPLVQGLKKTLGLKELIGQSRALLAAMDKIPCVANCDAAVLITGETGTGKELCARSIHYLSPRSHRAFIAVNCGALPSELVENELFGHDPGAFTGAVHRQSGLILEAEGGTLFLDEIDAMPVAMQVKFLRFLQEKEYRPLGSSKARKADVRVIAASNAVLEEATKAGRFRQDLYYRLNVLSVLLPPLRERAEDIPLLARHFLAKYAREYQRPVPELSSDALHKLLQHAWPGNVRELENVVQRAVLLAKGPEVEPCEILLPETDAGPGAKSFRALKARAVAQFERSYLQRLLVEHRGNVSASAQAAQKNRRAFWELLRKHHFAPQDFRDRV